LDRDCVVGVDIRQHSPDRASAKEEHDLFWSRHAGNHAANGDDATHGRCHSNMSPEVSHGPSHSAVVPNESECRACLRGVMEQSAIAVSGPQRCGLLGRAVIAEGRAAGTCALRDTLRNLAPPGGDRVTADSCELVQSLQLPQSAWPASRHCPAYTWP